MHSAWFISCGSIVLALAGCNQKATERDNISKPTDTVASVKPSASASAPPVVAVTEARCDNGIYVGPIATADASVGGGDSAAVAGDATDYGGLGLSGTGGGGGWGEGIGLGTVGGFGHGASAVKLKGQTLQVDGLPREDVERVVCASYPSFIRCVDDAATSANDLDGTVGLTLNIGEDGHASAKIIGGTLEDAKLTTCMSTAAATLAFDKPSSKSATVSYAFSAHRARKLKTVKMIETGTTVVGRLPPEVVKRIIRANFPRFRACYEQELKKDPTLKGTVATRFVIDATGAVESATSAGGTMGNAAVQACVTKVFGSLSFPEPEGGKVLVTYPINFENES